MYRRLHHALNKVFRMRWKPRDSERKPRKKRSRTQFAWVPKRLRDGTVVWLERYRRSSVRDLYYVRSRDGHRAD